MGRYGFSFFLSLSSDREDDAIDCTEGDGEGEGGGREAGEGKGEENGALTTRRAEALAGVKFLGSVMMPCEARNSG